MARLSSVSWRDFVKRLREFRFEGPYQGGKHPYMVKGDLVLTIPSPHRKDISPDLLTRILKRAGITRKEWLSK